MIDARKHTAPAAAETPRRQAFNDLSLSINDVVPVANATERAQLVSDLNAAGAGPSSTRPLIVDQLDHGVLYRTTNGTTWRRVTAFAEAAGQVTVASSASATGNAVTVTFPADLFTVAPIVLCALVSDPSAQFHAAASDITAASMKVNIYRTTGQAWSSGLAVSWTARQAISGSAAG